MFIKDGKPFNVNAPFTYQVPTEVLDEFGNVIQTILETINTGPGWLLSISAEEREALGITEVPDIPTPDTRFYNFYQLEDGSYSIKQKPLEELKDTFIRNVETTAANLRGQIVGNTSPAEMASWSIKQLEAHKFIASGVEEDAPMLKIEAVARGISLSALANKVMQKSMALSMLEAQISGNAGKHTDAIKAITSFNDIIIYDWNTGWPTI